jgi:mRNA interferase MazF
MIRAGVGGLAEQSVLLCEQIRVIDKRRLVRRTGNIEEGDLRKVGIALKLVLGLE